MPPPKLPTELLYSIVEALWTSPELTPPDRIQFMLSSKLVSKTWSLIYDNVFSYDIHIPSEPFYYHLFNDISLSPVYGETYLARCRRITFTVNGDISLSHDGVDDLAKSQDPEQTKLPVSLKFLSGFDLERLPSLQALNIVYYNAGFPDPCDQGFFISLPEYLPYLSVSYTFSPDISSSIIDNLRKTFTRVLKVRYASPKVGTLEINGGDEYIAAIWESLFPDRKRLIRNGKEEKQKLIPVHTVYDEKYAIEFLLRNLLRKLQFLELLDGANARQEHEEEDTAHVESGTNEEAVDDDDDDGLLPPAPDVSRSPTERSVAINTSKKITKNTQRKGTLNGDGDAPRVWENEAEGVKFLSNISSEKMNDLTFPSSYSLGDVGYVNAGTFSPLFNALEPYIVEGHMIPSLHGYGQVGMKDSSIDLNVAQTKNSSKRRVWGAIRKVWKSKGSARKKNVEFGTLDKNVAETWFKANADRVVEVCKKESMPVKKDDLVIIVSIFATNDNH